MGDVAGGINPAPAYAAKVTFPKPYQRKPKIGRELIIEPGCMAAPSAASEVNAATVVRSRR